MKKIIEFRMAEDCCVICGDHASLGSGHYFRGWKVGNGWYMDSEGWLCNKKVWICPTCCEAIVKLRGLEYEQEMKNGRSKTEATVKLCSRCLKYIWPDKVHNCRP